MNADDPTAGCLCGADPFNDLAVQELVGCQFALLDRSSPFHATSGAVGLAVIDNGVTAFDNVQVLKNASCT